MNRKIHTLLLLSVFILFFSCSKGENKGELKPAETIKVTLFTVQKQSLDDIYEISGTVVSRNPVKLVSKVMGTINEVRVDEGTVVDKGSLLMVIDAPEITANYEKANSAVAEAEKAVSLARINAKHAESTFKRYEKLYQEKAISLQEFENIEMKRNLALDEVKRTEAVLGQAKAEKERAIAMLSYTKVVAPISGVVTEKLANAGLNVMPGTPLVTVESDKNLRLEVNADEKVLPLVKKGQRLTVYFDSTKTEVNAIVSDIVPSVDPVSRTFKLKLDLPSDKSIKLGLYGTVRMPIGKKDVIVIPQSAVMTRGQLTYAYVLDKDSIATLRLIRTGVLKDGFVEVLSGLNEGDKVVKDAAVAKDGSKIIGE